MKYQLFFLIISLERILIFFIALHFSVLIWLIAAKESLKSKDFYGVRKDSHLYNLKSWSLIC